MYEPSKSAFRDAATQGNLIPVYREILADSYTPVSAYAALGGGDYSFLLESVVGGEKWAAYSFIGVRPRAILRCRGGVARVTWYDIDGGGSSREAEWQTDDAAAALREVMGEWTPVVCGDLPRFWGGAVGWVGYDVVRSFENLPMQAAVDVDVPELCVVLTDTLVIFDNLRQTIKVVATPYVPRPDKADSAYEGAVRRIDSVIETLRQAPPALAQLPVPTEFGREGGMRWGGGREPTSSFAKEDYLAAVERAKEYILAGDIFQVVLSQRFQAARDGVGPFDIYRALRVVNPSPYMFHLQFPEAQVTGASPETLVRCEGGAVELRPIAGTRPRGGDVEEDERLAAGLLADEKEQAEHVMLLDLGRNDVGRVSKTGTVEVTELMHVEHYSHVMHLVSNVRGELEEGVEWPDVLRAAFPAGTLSGAPKIRAMEIIDELEPHRRGVYGGAVGYVSYEGNMDMAIAIRTVVTHDESIYVQAGGGVVYDSTPEAEYEECLNKARAVLQAVELARQASGAKS